MIGQPALGAEAAAIAHAKTRTVFIIRADYLNRFLENLTIDSRMD